MRGPASCREAVRRRSTRALGVWRQSDGMGPGASDGMGAAPHTARTQRQRGVRRPRARGPEPGTRPLLARQHPPQSSNLKPAFNTAEEGNRLVGVNNGVVVQCSAPAWARRQRGGPPAHPTRSLRHLCLSVARQLPRAAAIYTSCLTPAPTNTSSRRRSACAPRSARWSPPGGRCPRPRAAHPKKRG